MNTKKSTKRSANIRMNLLILAALLLATGIWTSLSNDVPPTQTAIQEPVQKNANHPLAPDFSYTTLDGGKSSLYAHKGKTVLLHFWASWCAPCVNEFPTLLDLAVTKKGEQKKDFIILAVSTNEKRSDIEKFLKKLKREIPTNIHLIQDADKSISQDIYQTMKLPETYVISSDSAILEKVIGPQENWNTPAWKAKISPPTSE